MPKHIGIVACSAEGAALCYQTICRESVTAMGEHMHPEISLHNIPLGDYMEPIDKGNWLAVADIMLRSAEKLKAAGAEFLICPDNTIHEAFPQLEDRSPLPWLHIAREVAREATARGYRKSAILGTKYLMSGPVYPEAFDEEGLEYEIPTQSIRDRIDLIIFRELVYADIRKESRKYFHTQIKLLKTRGCDSVVLGCTEIPLIVLPEKSPLPVLDSTRILARAAIRHAFSV